MKVYLAADHAGFPLKQELVSFVRTLGHSVDDCGAHALDMEDDYPGIIRLAAQKLSDDVEANRGESRLIVIGGSGQGEAIVANRHKWVRCALFYGEPVRPQVDAAGKTLDLISSTRIHNDANALSLGARFITVDEAKEAVKKWLATEFTFEERHKRRVWQIDSL